MVSIILMWDGGFGAQHLGVLAIGYFIIVVMLAVGRLNRTSNWMNSMQHRHCHSDPWQCISWGIVCCFPSECRSWFVSCFTLQEEFRMSCAILLVTPQLLLETCMYRSTGKFVGKLTSECIWFLWPAQVSLGTSDTWRNLLLSPYFVELAFHAGDRNWSHLRGPWR